MGVKAEIFQPGAELRGDVFVPETRNDSAVRHGFSAGPDCGVVVDGPIDANYGFGGASWGSLKYVVGKNKKHLTEASEARPTFLD